MYTSQPIFNCLLILFLLGMNVQGNKLAAQVISIGVTGVYPTLEDAEPFITPGDTLLLQSQVFSNGSQFLTLNGTAAKPIVIMAEVQHEAIFNGGSESIHLVNCNYIEINGIVAEQQTGNGMNIDDGGNYTMPSKHITIRNCIFRDMNATGNNDLLKMSGVDSFLIENCQFIDGGAGGSGVDFVGCHYGVVQDCLFDNPGTSGIQNKGGTQFIRIQRNLFKNVSQRALNLGGSTGLQFFRPPLPDPIVDAFEAADLDVFSNVFIGNWAPIAYVGCVRAKVYNNTFYSPENWVIRILQETTEPGFLTCGDNEFSNNIIYLLDDLTEVNIGPNTDPSSFEFTNNLWFNLNSNNWSPNLPVTDPNQIIEDPIFVDLISEDYQLQSSSPAISTGFTFEQPETDFIQNFYYDPPSRGAYEGHSSILEAHIEVQSDAISIYPNPSANNIKIEGDFTDYTINVLDVSGTILMTYTNSTSPLVIQLNQLPKGLFFVQLINNTNGQIELKKIIKM